MPTPLQARAAAYAHLRNTLRPGPDRGATMREAADALWDALSPSGVSWTGFYSISPERDQLVLGPCRDKPACSPIGLHGVCGRAWREGRAVVVRDVADLGDAYVACDPRDRSEVAVPLFEAGACWGVLDLDSGGVGAFSELDAEELQGLMELIGLTRGPAQGPPIIV
jgi:putative methionine-R-sulfoxide reductase with GAF domain